MLEKAEVKLLGGIVADSIMSLFGSRFGGCSTTMEFSFNNRPNCCNRTTCRRTKMVTDQEAPWGVCGVRDKGRIDAVCADKI